MTAATTTNSTLLLQNRGYECARSEPFLCVVLFLTCRHEGSSAFMVTRRWASPPPKECLEEHSKYLRSFGTKVSISGRFGGGDGSGGVTMLLRVSSMEEAQNIARDDPVEKLGAYSGGTEISEWMTEVNNIAALAAAEVAMHAASSSISS